VILHWWLLGAAIATSLLGQTLLKAGSRATDMLAQLLDWRTMLGLGLYGVAALLYIAALRRIPLSVALPSTAVSYIAAVLVGHFAFAEPIGPAHVAAVALISLGVVLLAAA
jgi:multidrug transporter EmrE-like cation transporter